jgi:hypothetical protein
MRRTTAPGRHPTDRDRLRLTSWQAVLVVALLAGSLTACGASTDTGSAADSPAPPSKAATPKADEAAKVSAPDTTFERIDPEIYPALIAEVGASTAADVTNQMIDTLTDYAYAEDIVTADVPEQLDKLRSLSGSMTHSGARAWRDSLDDHVNGTAEQHAKSPVLGLVWWGLLPEEGIAGGNSLPAAEGQTVINPKFQRVQTWLLDDGRIGVKVETRVDLRMRKAGKPKILGGRGTHTFCYEQVGHEWLLDTWRSELKFADKLRKDPYAN